VALLLVVCVQLGVVWQLHTATSVPPPAGGGHDSSPPTSRSTIWGGATHERLTLGLWIAEPVLVDSPAILYVPLLLPGITAIDLVVDRRAGGSFGERVSTAALTVLTPLFWLLELRRLQAATLPAPSQIDSAGSVDPVHQSRWEGWINPCS